MYFNNSNQWLGLEFSDDKIFDWSRVLQFVGASCCTISQLSCAEESSLSISQAGESSSFLKVYYLLAPNNLLLDRLIFHFFLFFPPLFKINCRWVEPYWQLSLQKSEGGPLMLEEDSITALLMKEVDFVLMQIFLFAYIMPLFN